MEKNGLAHLSVDDLVEIFRDIALAQDECLLSGNTKRYNILYEDMKFVEVELKQRSGDQRHALTVLFGHPNAQVRMKAAVNALAVEREAASAVLRRISDWNEYPQAADARGLLAELDEGTYRPE